MSQTVWADTRQVAMLELKRLHHAASAVNVADELKSADATFAIAEHYFQTDDIKESERFYLLTIQKARIIHASLQDTFGDSTSAPVVAPPPLAETETSPSEPIMPEPEVQRQEVPTPDADPPPVPDTVPESPEGTQEPEVQRQELPTPDADPPPVPDTVPESPEGTQEPEVQRQELPTPVADPAPVPDTIPESPEGTQEPEVQRQELPTPDADPPPVPDTVPGSPAGTQEYSVPPPEPETEFAPDEVTSDKLVGTSSSYSVQKGDTIRLVAAKLGVSRQQLIKRNRLEEKAYLKIGQKLVYNNRKIVPQRMTNGIVVNIPDRTLYYFKQGRLAVSLPVALGVPVKSEKYDWKTPTGKFRVTAKMKDPTWNVPPSIQSEMEDLGREIITRIPPGPENPLGKYAIKTSLPGILIHSTTKPWSIYSFASHGCIRVYPEQMEGLFKEVMVNTPGEIIYQPVKLAITEEGRVFLEVHRDVYGKSSSGLAREAKRLIEKQKLSERVNWRKVESIVQHTAGIAEDITL
ncbi:MAG: L,D-transpeptidase family protein [Geobacteraceae bacterium]|nr:L,D-transpeptidase family protein [Geobacteraceae bacterium]